MIALSSALAIIAGVILVVAGLLRLGFVTNFLPEPALVGFLFGMALIIVVRQAGKIVGVSTGDGDFFERAWHILSQLDSWSLTTVAVGLVAIGALLLLERLAPRVPASLVVLVAGIAHLDPAGPGRPRGGDRRGDPVGGADAGHPGRLGPRGLAAAGRRLRPRADRLRRVVQHLQPVRPAARL